MNDTTFDLNENKWILKPAADTINKIPRDIKIPAQGVHAKIPGDIYLDLLNAGLINDPFYGDNELSLDWIANCNWEYETVFTYEDISRFTHLVFDGLDTIADIYLNGSLLGQSENMFLRYSFPVKKLVHHGNNILKVKFYSAIQKASELSSCIRQLPSARHPNRVFIRKAQYSFGWDWGPAFPGVGIWKNVYLQKDSQVKIISVGFETTSIDNDSAYFKVSVCYQNPLPAHFNIKIKLSGHNQEITDEFVAHGVNVSARKLQLAHPKLWWPHNLGDPNLYDLEISVFDKKGQQVELFNQKVGIRKVELRLKEDGQECFKFLINDCPLFLKGANWIPGDSFLPRVGKKKYSELITAARNANMNILRVWGGGIYEDDYFYELCDREGIMVWQDFMFACATYPEDEHFIANVKNEISQNVNRLKYHPSISIWCGNNETEWIWHQDNCGPLSEMPGFELFHTLIPDWLKTLDPTRPYWPSSPFGDENDPNSEQSGNRHLWDIWSNWVDYSQVVNDKSLFVSEFGFQAPAMYETFKTVLSEKALKPQSALFEFHNKQDEGPERLFRFLSGHLPVVTDIKSFIYLTQLNQGLALKKCIEHWRFRWPETSGSIIWQLNDCWPVSSWSLIDSELRRKHAYFFSKHSFQNILVGFTSQDESVKALVLNDSCDDFNGYLEFYEWSFDTHKSTEVSKSLVTINAGSKKGFEIFLIEETANKCVIIVLSDKQGKIIARNWFSLKKWKHITLPKPLFSLEYLSSKKLKIIASSGLFFIKLEHYELEFDNLPEIMLAGEEFEIDLAKGELNTIKMKDIQVSVLNNFLCEM